MQHREWCNSIEGENDSLVGSPPAAGTRGALSIHLHFIWDTQESLVVHFNYTCYSLVPLLLKLLSLEGHLVSKVSNEWFISDRSGFAGQLLQSTHQFFGYQKKLYLFWSHPCRSNCLSVLPPVLNNTLIVYIQLSLSTVNCQECRPLDTTCAIIIPVKYSLLLSI